MPSPALDLELLGYVLATLAYLGLAARLIFKGPLRQQATPSPARLVFAGALALSALWSAAASAMLVSPGSALSLTATLLDVARYGLWFSFLLLLQAPHSGSVSRSNLLRSVGVFLVLAGCLLPLWPALAQTHAGHARLALFGKLALPVFGLLLVEQLFRNLTEDSRWNAKPLCAGLLLLFGFDFYLYSEAVLIGESDAVTVSVRGALHALTVPFLLVAIGRHPNWTGELKLSRTAAFHSLVLVLAGSYLIFISAVGYYVRYVGGTWGEGLQLGLFFVALVGLLVLASSGTLRSQLRVLVGKHFFSYRYDYRLEWLRFTSMLSTRALPHETGGLVIKGLANMVESPGGGLWVKDLRGESFVQSARWNVPAVMEPEPAEGAFARFLAEHGWIVEVGEHRSGRHKHDGLDEPDWLASNPDIWLVIPLLTTDELIGFVTLAKPRAAIDVNWEVTDLLKTASRQAASVLAQMHAAEALLEARKFDAFNRMSAFVVHDLKNIVTQLSLMLKNAPRLQHNAEFRQDMLMTVESSLDKMRQLILQLREGESTAGGVAGVELWPIAQRLQSAAGARGRSLQLQLGARVATRGHEGRIERVLGHVVQNAFDATPTSGTVWIKLDREGGQAKVEVGDTGVGMSPEFVRDQLFRPFQTSKEHGMGIGAYESFQYVQELGGKISVDSAPGRGTVVTLLLPLFESRQHSDIHAASSTA